MAEEQSSLKGFRFFAISMAIGIPAMMFVPAGTPTRIRQIPFYISGLAGILCDYLFVREECIKRNPEYTEVKSLWRRGENAENIDFWGREIKDDKCIRGECGDQGRRMD